VSYDFKAQPIVLYFYFDHAELAGRADTLEVLWRGESEVPLGRLPLPKARRPGRRAPTPATTGTPRFVARVPLENSAMDVIELEVLSCLVHTQGEFSGNLDVSFRIGGAMPEGWDKAVLAGLRLGLPGDEKPLEVLGFKFENRVGHLTFHAPQLEGASPPQAVNVLWGPRDREYLGELPCTPVIASDDGAGPTGSPERISQRARRRPSLFDRVAAMGAFHVAGYAFLFCVLLIWAGAVAMSVRPLQLAFHGQRTEGVVISIETGTTTDDNNQPVTYRTAVVQFQAGERVRKFTVDGTGRSKGERIPVRYLPSQPDVAQVDSVKALYAPPAGAAGMALVTTLVSVGFFVAARRGKAVRNLQNSRLGIGG
jgi:hypothetical protein